MIIIIVEVLVDVLLGLVVELAVVVEKVDVIELEFDLPRVATH